MLQKLDASFAEKKILEDFKLGNQQVFKALHTEFFKPICFFAHKMIQDKTAAEDIATESFIKLWNQPGGFDSLAQVKAFLYTTTKNACLNHLRDTQLHESIHRDIETTGAISDNTIEYNLVRAEWMQLIWHEIDSLPPACKQICILLVKERLTSAEIANRLGISPQNVDTQITRAAKRIKTTFIRQKIILLFAIFITRLF
jgi:RNA polymerase sigma-70 factor (ECF subfamily)